MLNKRQKIIVLVFLVLIIPISVILVLTNQLILKKAAFGEVTVNFLPTTTTAAIGTEFPVQVYFNSGTIPISAISIKSLNLPPNLTLTRAVAETGTGKPFTDFIGGTTDNLLPFTILSKKSTTALPTGSFLVATLYFKALNPTMGTVSLNQFNIEAVGYNQNNDDVSLTLKAGTNASYTPTGSLCKISACPDIALQQSNGTDETSKIILNWTAPSSTQNYIYQIYGSVNTPVPANNPTANLIKVTDQNTFSYTFNSGIFKDGDKFYYNVDAFTICP